MTSHLDVSVYEEAVFGRVGSSPSAATLVERVVTEDDSIVTAYHFAAGGGVDVVCGTTRTLAGERVV